MGFFDKIFNREPALQTLSIDHRFEVKKAFDAARFGVAGVPNYPDTDRLSLLNWERKNELVFACIRKKCEAAADPELIVEKKNGKGEWETVDGHQLVALLEKPNPQDTWDTFMAAWIASEEITGDFYAEIVRDGRGIPTALWPLDPSKMIVIPDSRGMVDHYEFHSGYGIPIRLEIKDVLHRRRPHVGTSYYGQSPLAIALGAVDADKAQTDYVRAFFHSDGIPAGLLKVANVTLSEAQAEQLQQRWMRKYRRGGTNQRQVAVLDQNASFEKLGTNLKEIESEVTRGQIEARICMVFGVPPALIGAYVGLKLATNNATMRSHMQDFWFNTMSPMLKTMRTFLTWELLSEFESIDSIRQKRIRVNYDMTQVMAMQEDDNSRHSRARDNFAAGMWTINEARDQTGQEPLDEDYFVSPLNVEAITEAVRLALASQVPQRQPAQLQQGQDPNTVDGQIVDEPPPKQIGDGKSLSLSMPVSVVTPAAIPAKSQVKTVEYQGMTLSREPNAFEMMLDLKAINDGYDSEKARLTTILLNFRKTLIGQVADAVNEHDASTIYQLILTPPPDAAKKLRKEIEAAVELGRQQVASELAKQGKSLNSVIETKDKKKTIAEWINELVDLLISRTVNEIQTRAASIFAALGTLGLDKQEIVNRIESELDDQSTKVFESFASQTANAAINSGRREEMTDRASDIDRYQWSAILDKNTCPNCEELDGKESDTLDGLPDAPLDSCEGQANCRCFVVAIGHEGNA